MSGVENDLFGELLLGCEQIKPRHVHRLPSKKVVHKPPLWVRQLEFLYDGFDRIGLPEDFADKAWQIIHESLLYEVVGQFKDTRAKVTNLEDKWHWITTPLVPKSVASYIPLTFQACCLVLGVNPEDMQEGTIKEVLLRNPGLQMPTAEQNNEMLADMQRRYLEMRMRLLEHSKNSTIRDDVMRWVYDLQEYEFSFEACIRAYGSSPEEIREVRKKIITGHTRKELCKAG